MSHATLDARGRITVPLAIRRRMALETGDRIAFTVLPNGSAVMRAKKRSITDLAGSVKLENGRRVALDDLGFD